MTAVRKLDLNEQQNASLNVDGQTLELPLVAGSANEKAIDISALRAKTGIITLDNGYMNTGACTSAITFLNGEQGILEYRGYPIEQVAEKLSFLDTAYLLIYGHLPSSAESKEFQGEINRFSETPNEVLQLIKSFPKNAHPMAALSAFFGALSAFYPELCDQDLNDEAKRRVIALHLAQAKNFIAYTYRAQNSLEFVPSDPSLSYTEDFLHMMFGNKADREISKALDVLLILHADHEQNCSTSTVRMVGSSKATVFASIASGINALSGPLHGGANQSVLEMLEAIEKEGGDYKSFLERAKDKNDTFKLMGFGHRVYKNFDPRARIIKTACDMILTKLNIQSSLLTIAKGLEQEALKDQYFVDRKLYPNVDFYSGIIYKALNIPTLFFTPMFVLGRMPGWLAQWKEMIESPGFKINRPRQIYVGEKRRDLK